MVTKKDRSVNGNDYSQIPSCIGNYFASHTVVPPLRNCIISNSGLILLYKIPLCSLIVHDFSNKKLYPDLKFISRLVSNTSDLKLETLFLICRTLLYFTCIF